MALRIAPTEASLNRMNTILAVMFRSEQRNQNEKARRHLQKGVRERLLWTFILPLLFRLRTDFEKDHRHIAGRSAECQPSRSSTNDQLPENRFGAGPTRDTDFRLTGTHRSAQIRQTRDVHGERMQNKIERSGGGDDPAWRGSDRSAGVAVVHQPASFSKGDPS